MPSKSPFLRGHAPRQFSSLLVSAQETPQDLFGLRRLRFHNDVRIKGMPGMAPKTKQRTMLDFPEWTVAFGAYKHRKITKSIFCFHGEILLRRNRRLKTYTRWNFGGFTCHFIGKTAQQRAH